jgi:DNA-binding response OmpR family regulator
MADVLVLDDEPDAVILLRKILRKKGHEVFVFTEEEDAIAFAAAHQVHLAILDIKLKKMSGIEVLRELKKIHPQMQVMMLTGYPTLDTAGEAVKLGADEYCVKPIELDEFEHKVDSILGRAQRENLECPSIS